MSTYIHDSIHSKGYNNTKRSSRRYNYRKEYFHPIWCKQGWVIISIFGDIFHDYDGFSLPRMGITFHVEKWSDGKQIYSGLLPSSEVELVVIFRHILPEVEDI